MNSISTPLGRRTTLPNNSTKQVELFDQAKQVPAQRLLVLSNAQLGYFSGRYTDRNFPATGENKVDSYLEFRNDKASGLGVPLPAGRIRVSRLDAADNSLEFIGEDSIGHTPRDEKVRVKLGSSFDVVGERKQVDFRSDNNARWMEEEIEVEVRKPQGRGCGGAGARIPVPLEQLADPLQQPGLQQGRRAHDHVPGEGAENSNRTVKYRVRYSW